MTSLILPLRPSDWKSVIGSKGCWFVGGGIREVVEGEVDGVGTGDHRESEATLLRAGRFLICMGPKIRCLSKKDLRIIPVASNLSLVFYNKSIIPCRFTN